MKKKLSRAQKDRKELRRHKANIALERTLKEGAIVFFKKGRMKGLRGIIEPIHESDSGLRRRVRVLNAMGQGDDLVFEVETSNLITRKRSYK